MMIELESGFGLALFLFKKKSQKYVKYITSPICPQDFMGQKWGKKLVNSRNQSDK